MRSMNTLYRILVSSSLLVKSFTFAIPFVHDLNHDISYQGITTSAGIEAFLGIPYGVSTSGSNRFAPPTPFSPSPGHIFNATAPGHSCPQSAISDDPESSITDIDEECLNLNVARPAGRQQGDDLLPVMVWIYGGGLNSGSANARTTAPDGLIRQSVENRLPVLYVAMNYRLNIFGFTTSEALSGSKSLNNGLRDQRLALEWVQDNIAAFGGDPSKVTIFGESSGGSVGIQVLAYGASKPVPFHSAIMQSTALEPGMSSNISFSATASIAVMANCLNSSDVTDFSPSSIGQAPEVISCLRSLSMETLLNLTDTYIAEHNNGDIFLPVVDQDFLPDLASTLVDSGKFPKMPLILGWDENDATIIIAGENISTPADTNEFISVNFPHLTSSTVSTLLSLYPSTDFQADDAANRSAEFYRSAEIFRDIIFVCRSLFLGSAMAEKYTTSPGPVFPNVDCPEPPVYLFANNQTILSSFLVSIQKPGLGVSHGSELAYIYGNLSLFNFTNVGLPDYTFSLSSSDYELAKQLPRSWTSFAYTGNPTLDRKETLPGWASAFPTGKGDGNVYVIGGGQEGMSGIDGEHNVEIEKEKLGERCAFLNSASVIEQLKY
ncbi:alpha/beta-hydrolase [Stipitochalara longipes BDJ]|nr:alpha/beta-hydrolase [Stipitochalara longipes BDJ]